MRLLSTIPPLRCDSRLSKTLFLRLCSRDSYWRRFSVWSHQLLQHVRPPVIVKLTGLLDLESPFS